MSERLTAIERFAASAEARATKLLADAKAAKEQSRAEAAEWAAKQFPNRKPEAGPTPFTEEEIEEMEEAL